MHRDSLKVLYLNDHQTSVFSLFCKLNEIKSVTMPFSTCLCCSSEEFQEFYFSAIPDQALGGPVIRTCTHCQAPNYDPWSGNQDPTSCDAQQKNVKPTKNGNYLFSLKFLHFIFSFIPLLALKYSQISLQWLNNFNCVPY